MKIYHGSSSEIRRPELALGKPHNDYGRGFYCTEDIEMAREWACKGLEPPGFANAYEFDIGGLAVLDLTSSGYSVLDWIAVLLANRTFDLDTEVARDVRDCLLANFMPPVGEADVVVGYRADDSYFNYADAFVNNALPLRRLGEAMRLGRLGLQIALRTERAFSRLLFLGAEEVPWAIYHSRYGTRDADARAEWFEGVRKTAHTADDVFAIDLMRKGVTHGDPGISDLLSR